MFVWELVAQRLRREGWSLRHETERAEDGPRYRVQIERSGLLMRTTGPTLTEAYADAARWARHAAAKAEAGPHRLIAAWLNPARA